MTTQQIAAPAPSGVGAAPAGTSPTQLEAWQRLQAARAAMAALPPLDPAYIAGERAWETWRRRNGD